jgi:diacylglycerol kinase (ATP)
MALQLEVTGKQAQVSRSAVMVGNIRSRKTTALFARARAMLTERGMRIEESYVSRDGKGAAKYVEAAVKAGAELVVVAGGDGSMTSVVGAFAHTTSILGVLPCGTGNSFARSLGIGPALEDAVETIVNGKAASVDLGVVNGRYFANFVEIGFSSVVARNVSDSLKKVTGPAAYVLAGIGALLHSKPFEARIRWDGNRKIDVRTHQLVVANGRYYGFVPILPGATIVDGKLTLLTAEGLSRWDVARLFIALFRGDQERLSSVQFFQAAEVTIKAKPKALMDVDGEPFGTTPARFSIARKALYVLVPRDFTGS